jgi:micrococcal nuclease
VSVEDDASGYPVVRVVDGDTVRLLINGKEETVRLIGINTPETVDSRRPVQCFGREASKRAKEILSDAFVFLENDPTQGDRDKYNRLLRYVLLPDGTNFNRKMIEEGYAHEYTYGVPYRYQSDFKEAERRAREAATGLWSEETCGGKS